MWRVEVGESRPCVIFMVKQALRSPFEINMPIMLSGAQSEAASLGALRQT